MSASPSPYPFASAPDIIRSHQKDAYFTGRLTHDLADLFRRLRGARAAHARGPELRVAAALLYYLLTTLPGNRTLGEEYCDLVQVDASGNASSLRLPAVGRRAAYVASSVLLPYLASRLLPHLRSRIRALLERRIATLRNTSDPSLTSREARLWNYILQHVSPLTSSAPLQAGVLALFYFTGTYYELAKRLLSLRYVFTRTVADSPDRAGYELLGVLLVVQLGVQGYMHVRDTLSSSSSSSSSPSSSRERSALGDVSLDHEGSYNNNNDLLLSGGAGSLARIDVPASTHTPAGPGAVPRFQLVDDGVMGFIKGAQQRKCTLCLDEMRDPAATQCGHVFCWECIGDWVREKPECPLCRREAMAQHILPLRVM